MIIHVVPALIILKWKRIEDSSNIERKVCARSSFNSNDFRVVVLALTEHPIWKYIKRLEKEEVLENGSPYGRIHFFDCTRKIFLSAFVSITTFFASSSETCFFSLASTFATSFLFFASIFSIFSIFFAAFCSMMKIPYRLIFSIWYPCQLNPPKYSSRIRI